MHLLNSLSSYMSDIRRQIYTPKVFILDVCTLRCVV